MADTKHRALSEKRREAPAGCMALFFLAFLLAGLAVVWFLAVSPVLGSLAARGWQETPCTVISSEVRAHAGDDGETYSVDIRYRYEVDGGEFVSDRYGFFAASSSGRSSKQEIVDRYPPGRACTCWVDPRNPGEAVLDRGIPGESWFGLMGLPFVLVGGGGLWWLLVAAPRRRALAAHRALTAREGIPMSAGRTADEGPDGTVTLAPETSGRAKAIALAIFAILWNGIIGFMLAAASREGIGWFALFFVPFIAAGTFLVGMTLHAFLGLFNPRVILTLGPGAARLGSIVPVAWRIDGRSMPRNLRMVFLGREVATFRRGTDSVTEKETFHETVLLDADDPAVLERGGRLELEIPAGSMHTFEASNNKVHWRIVVTGEIPRWPDIRDEYPVTVLPAEAAHG